MPPPPPAVALPIEPPPVNFRNTDALKTALIGALLSTCLFFLPFVNWLAAGYFAVFFYRRRTHQSVNIVAGVRIGWLTGLMTFAILAVLILVSVLMLRVPGVMDELKAQAQKSAWMQQALSASQNESQVFASLPGYFIFINFLSMTGGLLGAVMTGRVNPRPPGGNIV
jgi:ABC-type uncharacterized transport system YnjBCD permease subunit